MKTLFLIRHAKSTWNIPGISDIDRPLNERGYSDAHEMAARIKKKFQQGVIISSPATRAISTALIFARHLNYPADGILIHPLLYDTNTKQYSSIIEALPIERDFAIVIGHNPVISETANCLADRIWMRCQRVELLELNLTNLLGKRQWNLQEK